MIEASGWGARVRGRLRVVRAERLVDLVSEVGAIRWGTGSGVSTIGSVLRPVGLSGSLTRWAGYHNLHHSFLYPQRRRQFEET